MAAPTEAACRIERCLNHSTNTDSPRVTPEACRLHGSVLIGVPYVRLEELAAHLF